MVSLSSKRIGDRDEAPTVANAHRRGLIVVEEIAGVDAAEFREQVDGGFAMRQRRRQVAGGPTANGLFDRVHGFSDHVPLLRLAHAVCIARVVDAVSEELPIALATLGNDFRVVGDQRGGQRYGAADAVLVEQCHLTRVADAIAVVTDRVARHGGIRMRPRRSLWIAGRIELVKFDVGGDPEGQARPIGPGDPGPVPIGPVVVVAGIFFHASLLGVTGPPWRCAGRARPESRRC